jgi:hypothetical protein
MIKKSDSALQGSRDFDAEEAGNLKGIFLI